MSRSGLRRLALVLLPLGLVGVALGFVRLPYFVVEPGPAQDVVSLIRIGGHPTYPGRGRLLLTSVLFEPATAYEALVAWWSPVASVVPERQILGPGGSEEERRQALSEMDTSKIDAAYVVLARYTAYPEEHGPGALVESVIPGSPADGKLFPGDLIVSVDGEPLQDVQDLGRRVRAAGVGRTLTLRVEAGGASRTVRVAPALLPRVARDRPVIGVSVVEPFPFPLSMESGAIGGPSAGLMWALGLVELLTPGDLTGGRVVAGTGQLALDGRVLPVLGVPEKVAAAERAGASVFFAPAQNAPEARAVARRLTVVPVRTYLDAVAFLQRGRP
ncbi:MAG TPA: PDZ domain-containing protein [Actinomycetota bacterium]|nr:PDZ domain-containing protein [Actinomycetota bacterium]